MCNTHAVLLETLHRNITFRGIYTREETIQGRKLFVEIRDSHIFVWEALTEKRIKRLALSVLR